MPFFEKDDVRIHYEEAGSGFPVLAIPGGGLNSRIAVWGVHAFNPMESLNRDFRCITMDLRNAIGGASTGPLPVDDPWGAFADDQLRLMDHLGIDEFFFTGNCIGGSFAGKLLERAPERVRAAIFCQPMGSRPDDPTFLSRFCRESWVPTFLNERPEVSEGEIDTFMHNLFDMHSDFLFSVSRDFMKTCQTPILVMPDDTLGHPMSISVEVASLAPNAEITVYPWKEPEELRLRTIERARQFLKAHAPAR